MPEGSSHVDYSCPGCGKVFRSAAENAGREARCPDCGAGFTIPSPGPAPAQRIPPRSRYAAEYGDEGPEEGPVRRTRMASRSEIAYRRHAGRGEPEGWANRYAIFWGIALLFALFVPMPIEKYKGGGWGSRPQTETTWIFLWDQMDDAKAEGIIAMLSAIGVGIFAIVAGANMRKVNLGHALFWTTAAAFLLNFLLAKPLGLFGEMRREMEPALVIVMLLLFATPVIAAGNHARKYRPDAPAPKVMAGVGGIVIVACLLLPVFDDHPAIELLFKEGGWEEVPGIMVCFLAFVVWAILAIVSFTPGRIDGLTATLSVLGRCIMIGVPVVLLLTVATKSKDADFGTAFIGVLKGFLMLYGMLALAGTGLAAMAGEPDEARVPARAGARG